MSSSGDRGSGKAKLARLKAEQRRTRQRRILVAVTSAVVVVVLAVVGGVYLVSRQQHQDDLKKQQVASKSNAFISAVQTVPAASFNTVGRGGASNPPTRIAGAPALRLDGKPRMIFYGAEYCPFCAMERWSIVAALSRFGSFTGLTGSVSSEDNIPTMSFLKSSYTSQYLAFTSYETQGQTQGQALQTPPAADNALLNKYDSHDYIDSVQPGQGGPIPFMMYDGTYASAGSTYNQAQTMSGMSTTAVAATLENTSSPIAQGILGAANVITAQVCRMTGSKPASVCTSPAVQKAASKS